MVGLAAGSRADSRLFCFMNDFATHARAMGMVQSRLADDCPTIAWNSQTYKLIPGSVRREQDLASGGFTNRATLSCEALVSTFLSDTIADSTALEAALQRTPIGYLGRQYQVEAIHISPGGLQARIEATAIEQGA